MKLILILLVSCCSVLSLADQVFDMSAYVGQCGDEFFPRCENEALDALSLIEAAEKYVEENEMDGIVLISCEDGVNLCDFLGDNLKSGKEVLSSMKDNRLILPLHINRLLDPIEEIAHKFDVTSDFFISIPGIIRKERGGKGEEIKLNSPSSYSGVEALAAKLSVEYGRKYLKEKASKIDRIAHIPFEAFKVPVDLNESYGQYPYFKRDGVSIYRMESTVDELINAGLARLHTYHDFDAARLFYRAVQSDPNDPLARAFLALAVADIENFEGNGALYANYQLAMIEDSPDDQLIKLWVNFIRSYLYGKIENLSGDANHYDAFADFNRLQAYSEDPETLTLPVHLLFDTEKVNPFIEALKIKNDHVGAHHYLIHSYEEENAFIQAKEHAQAMSLIAVSSAHAQHMYGHILPRFKEWKEAEKQFEWAAELHNKWAKKYSFPQHYDWHYSHNLDLTGAVYTGLGKVKLAIEAFKESCPYDSRACEALLKLAGVIGDQVSIDHVFELVKQRKTRFVTPQVREQYFIESYISQTKGKHNIYNLKMYSEISPYELDEVGVLIQTMVIGILYNEGASSDVLISEIQEEVSLYANERLGCSSFDGWGKGMLDMMRLWNVSHHLGYEEVAQYLERILKEQLGLDIVGVLKK